MGELVEHCSKVTGYVEIVGESIITQFLEDITNELSAGHEVDLAENSPRTPKNSKYKVVFQENKGLKQRLKV